MQTAAKRPTLFQSDTKQLQRDTKSQQRDQQDYKKMQKLLTT